MYTENDRKEKFITIGDFNTLLLVLDKISRQKINKDRQDIKTP